MISIANNQRADLGVEFGACLSVSEGIGAISALVNEDHGADISLRVY